VPVQRKCVIVIAEETLRRLELTMRLLISSLGVCILFIIGALALSLTDPAQSEIRAVDSPAVVTGTMGLTCDSSEAKTVTHAEEIEDIPVYPEAKKTSTGADKGRPGSGLYRFVSGATTDEISSFYKSCMATRGWVMSGEGKGSIVFPDARGIVFVWTHPKQDIPARRYLVVSLFPAREGNTEILLDFERWPDPEKVPLYPDAREVKINWASDPTYGFPERVTTYMAKVTPAEVEAYYQDMMIQHGWWSTPSRYAGLTFTYERGGPEAMTTSGVTVIAQSDANGNTIVELRVSGTEVRP
jgi:hypothetical protein